MQSTKGTPLSCFPLCHNTLSTLVTWQRWLVCDKIVGFFSRQWLSIPERCVVIVVSQPVIAPRRKPQMMLRWSVFLGTGNNSSPHSISTLMFLYLPLYFGPWKLPGDSASSCILLYLKTLVIQLSSECGVGACCMAMVVLDGIIRLRKYTWNFVLSKE